VDKRRRRTRGGQEGRRKKRKEKKRKEKKRKGYLWCPCRGELNNLSTCCQELFDTTHFSPLNTCRRFSTSKVPLTRE